MGWPPRRRPARSPLAPRSGALPNTASLRPSPPRRRLRPPPSAAPGRRPPLGPGRPAFPEYCLEVGPVPGLLQLGRRHRAGRESHAPQFLQRRFELLLPLGGVPVGAPLQAQVLEQFGRLPLVARLIAEDQ